MIGTQATTVALAWRTFTLTGSAAGLGLVLTGQTAAMLGTTLLAGALADRVDRKSVLIVADALRGSVLVGLALADVTGHLSIALLVAVAVVLGIGDGFFNPSFGGMVPLVVRSSHIASANSLIGFARQGAAVGGPTLAGILYERLTSSGVFAIDALTYAFAIVLLWRLPSAETRLSAASTGTTLGDIRDGLRYIGGVPWLWVTFALFASTGLLRFAPQQVLLPQLVEEHFHLGVGAYALLVSFIGLGLTLGMLAFGQLTPRRRRGQLLYLVSAVASLFFAGVAVSPVFAAAVGLATLHGLAFGFAIGLWETAVVELVPGQVLSRVISVNYLSAFGLLPLGMLLTGVAAAFLPPGAILAAGAVGTAGLFIALLPRTFIQMLD
ncbi:MAG: MFS transporter [Chloroflexota bacterium]|nr:MFS transporter [Chloroflexota bacterium]